MASAVLACMAKIARNKKSDPAEREVAFFRVGMDYFAAAKFSPTLVQFTTAQNAAM